MKKIGALQVVAWLVTGFTSLAFAGHVNIQPAADVKTLSLRMLLEDSHYEGEYCVKGVAGLWFDYKHIDDLEYICTATPLSQQRMNPSNIQSLNSQLLSAVPSYVIAQFEVTAINGAAAPASCSDLVSKYDLQHNKEADVLVTASGCSLKSS